MVLSSGVTLYLSAPLVVICGKHEAIQKSIGWPFFKLRAPRAKAKGAEKENSDEQEWAVSPTNITAEPLNSPARWRGLMSAGGSTIGH